MAQRPKRKFHPLPAPGDIVWCTFPQVLGQPGPKHRPASKFDVAAQLALPFDSDWFAAAPGPQLNRPLPKMGVLHPSYMPAITAALKNRKP